MAKDILIRSTSVNKLGANAAEGQVEIYLDNSGEIPATFKVALHSGVTVIPMCAIDPKGIITFRYHNSTYGGYSLDVTATEADGSTTTTKTTTLATLAAKYAGQSIASA